MEGGVEPAERFLSRLTITIVAVSLGGGEYTAPCDAENPSRKAAIDLLNSVDIATVISSGNGADRNALASPACISGETTSGASASMAR